MPLHYIGLRNPILLNSRHVCLNVHSIYGSFSVCSDQISNIQAKTRKCVTLDYVTMEDSGVYASVYCINNVQPTHVLSHINIHSLHNRYLSMSQFLTPTASLLEWCISRMSSTIVTQGTGCKTTYISFYILQQLRGWTFICRIITLELFPLARIVLFKSMSRSTILHITPLPLLTRQDIAWL